MSQEVTVDAGIIETLKSLKPFAAVSRDGLPPLENVYVKVSDNRVTLRATNRYVLASIEGETLTGKGEITGCLTHEDVGHIAACLEDHSTSILTISEHGIGHFGQIFATWLKDPGYPDTDRIIPQQFDDVVVNESLLLSGGDLAKLAQIRFPYERPSDAKRARWLLKAASGKKPTVWTREFLGWEALVLIAQR